MGAKTKFKKEDFENILSKYNIGKYKSFKNFKFGWCQTNILLQTTKGKYVLKYYENR